ncbi:MAG TPA: PAS domain S-box protein, partial [Kofleriaceae bacterium]|nr:PAS domain S-box protein [Kofleriaceae bacterium]
MPRNTPIFAHTFEGLGTVRLDDVREDPRYGQVAPHHGMPAGHLPVVSYLAVPVRSRTGKVIGGLFFGHPEPARFTAQHESAIRALSVTAAIALDNAELYRSAREAEDAQRRSVEKLVDTVRMNELFTGVLAHDLRSPLAAVMTASELLHTRAGESEKRIAERVLTSTRRMTRMIEQLLDFTRIRVGTGLPIDTRPCDLQTMLPHVIDELRVKHPTTPFAFDAIGATTGRWDEDRLAQAFSNLIGNAAQHGQPDAGVVVIVDGTEDAVIRVRVQNAGTIPEELLPKIFEPMIGGQRRRDGSRGLGIGLFITREIAISHGGTITVESSPDQGTSFIVELPREVASVEASTRENQPAQVDTVNHHERTRLLVDGIQGHAIFMIDEKGRVSTWSSGCERIFGWRAKAVLDEPFARLHVDEGNTLALELGRAESFGSSEYEAWYLRDDGTRIWVRTSLSALRAGSRLVGYGVVARELTAQRAMQQKLEDDDARMRLMIDSVRDYAIFLLDADGNVASWNRGAQLTKGYTSGEIVGRHVSTFYTREDRETGRPAQLLAKAVRDGRVEHEGWRVRKDGSRFWADVVITALRDHAGVLRGFAKVTRDLTDRRRAEDELRRSEERFRLLVDSVKDYAIFLLDPVGHVMTWNAGAERTNGYRAHEIVGEHFSRFYDPEEVRAGKCDRELEVAARDGKFEEEGWRIRKDGTRFWA